MPYITESQREALLEFGIESVETPGELNYAFTLIIRNYLSKNKHSYQTYNDCIGALEACKLELYRRMVAPYEDKKIEENGDVY